MNAETLVARLEALDLKNVDFRHRQHLEAAFFYIRRDGVDAGERAMLRAISAFASHEGHIEKFNITLTVCWIRLVAAAMAEAPDCRTADELVERHPALLDKNLPLQFYSRDLLFSVEARLQTIGPDIGPLPLVGGMMLNLIPKVHRASHAVAVLIAGSPELSLNQAEAAVLASLWPTKSSTINELHATFGHRRSTLTSVLDRLERRSLVKRSTSDLDRRIVQVTLTGAGKKLALRIHTLLSNAEARVRKKFSSAEIEAFCAVSDAFLELGADDR